MTSHENKKSQDEDRLKASKSISLAIPKKVFKNDQELSYFGLWIQSIEGVEIKNERRVVRLLVPNAIKESHLRELIAAFRRYSLSLKDFNAFLSVENWKWFADKVAPWFSEVFGSEDQVFSLLGSERCFRLEQNSTAIQRYEETFGLFSLSLRQIAQDKGGRYLELRPDSVQDDPARLSELLATTFVDLGKSFHYVISSFDYFPINRLRIPYFYLCGKGFKETISAGSCFHLGPLELEDYGALIFFSLTFAWNSVVFDEDGHYALRFTVGDGWEILARSDRGIERLLKLKRDWNIS